MSWQGVHLRSKAKKLRLVTAENLLQCFTVVWLPAPQDKETLASVLQVRRWQQSKDM